MVTAYLPPCCTNQRCWSSWKLRSPQIPWFHRQTDVSAAWYSQVDDTDLVKARHDVIYPISKPGIFLVSKAFVFGVLLALQVIAGSSLTFCPSLSESKNFPKNLTVLLIFWDWWNNLVSYFELLSCKFFFQCFFWMCDVCEHCRQNTWPASFYK